MQFKGNLGWYIKVEFFLAYQKKGHWGNRRVRGRFSSALEMFVFGFIMPNTYLLLSHCTFLIAKQSQVFIIEVNIDRL